MEVIERIKQQVEENPVIIYMKGTPQFPSCGFSARTIDILKSYGQEFAFVNILMDQDIRANMHKYSDWPTFPQLFIKGELVGGCDICVEMHEAGQLEPLIKAAAGSSEAS